MIPELTKKMLDHARHVLKNGEPPSPMDYAMSHMLAHIMNDIPRRERSEESWEEIVAHAFASYRKEAWKAVE